VKYGNDAEPIDADTLARHLDLSFTSINFNIAWLRKELLTNTCYVLESSRVGLDFKGYRLRQRKEESPLTGQVNS